MKKILIVDDSLTICLMLKSWIVKKGYTVETATNVEDAKKLVKEKPIDLILSDIRMPETDGFSFLSWIKKYDSGILVIMMTGFADIESAVESMKSGAVDYISKPIEPDLLFKKIEDSFKLQANQNESQRFFNTFLTPPSKEYKTLLKKLDELAESKNHFLLVGDRGVGKASVARYVYEKGIDDVNPFVVLDADQICNNLADSYDAEEPSILMQKMDLAKGGLLYVRKVHKLDKRMQDELLSLLTKQKRDENFTQIIVSTEKNKSELETFLLPKLYQLLEKACVEIPSLCTRKDDILFFAHHFVSFANSELDKNIQSIAPEIQKQLIDYSWPGNVQELKNIIVKAALLAEGTEVSADLLPALFKVNSTGQAFSQQQVELSVKGLRKENYEREKIIEALELAKGNKTMAASILNIDRKTLYNKLKLYSVEYAN